MPALRVILKTFQAVSRQKSTRSKRLMGISLKVYVYVFSFRHLPAFCHACLLYLDDGTRRRDLHRDRETLAPFSTGLLAAKQSHARRIGKAAFHEGGRIFVRHMARCHGGIWRSDNARTWSFSLLQSLQCTGLVGLARCQRVTCACSFRRLGFRRPHTQEVSAHGTRTRAMVGLFPDGINSECSRCRAFPRQAAHPWNLDCLWFLLSGVCLLTGSVGGSWIARRPCGLQICLDLCLTYKFLQATLTCLYSSGQQAASYRVGNAPNSGAEENHCGFSGTVR